MFTVNSIIDTSLLSSVMWSIILQVWETGKTYRFRVHNVGTSTSLNFRIQNHNMRLIETEGTYTNQQNFTNLDIHVGQSYSFLVTMDQNASTDYYIVASPRFVSNPQWSEVTGVALLQYSNSKGGASGPLPDAPNDYYDKYYSMNQAKSIRLAHGIPKVLCIIVFLV
jgi:FtsP/CotA-like multicopper oxidase with cupredoxin domain